jgi:FkbM family methyltransferase
MKKKVTAALMRKHIVMLLSGTPLERIAWSAYTACRDRMPAAMISPGAAKARRYDRLTIEIARRALHGGGNSVDIGAHYGSILKGLVKLSPAGSHWAFEPIPNLAKQLRKKFPGVTVSEFALSDYTGTTEFNFLPGSPAFSSLLSRPNVEAGQQVRQLRVDVRKLDDCIPENVPIAFIKVDVEGAEAAVLRGASQLLERHKPVVVFECAPTKLAECASALEDVGLRIGLMADHLAGQRRDVEDVLELGRESGEYYYVASGG